MASAVVDQATAVAIEAAQHMAPAKINLALHVTGRRADGYHLLSSLVAFADVGDRLTLEPSHDDALHLRGPFAATLAGSLPPSGGNSVQAAIELVRAVLRERGSDLAPLRVALEKNLPVASGIGGGSADAAAILRVAIASHPALAIPLHEAAVRLGADVPMCIDARAAFVSGIGETRRELAAFPVLSAVLVNPGVPVSTPAVFALLSKRDHPPLDETRRRFSRADDVLAYLRQTRNDLEEPAIAVAPIIAETRTALENTGAAFARMSGSGATVFGLFVSRHDAERAAAEIAAARPSWWVRPTVLGSASDFER